MKTFAAMLRRLEPLGVLSITLAAPLASIGLTGCAALAALSAPTMARADDDGAPAALPLVSPLFSDNMVLQRGRPVVVWGWTQPGQAVVVSIGGKSAVTNGDAQGKWTAKLPALPVGGPYTMTITAAEKTQSPTARVSVLPRGPYLEHQAIQTYGSQSGAIQTQSRGVTLGNILVGDVWVCSGQSNMEMGIGNVTNAAQEIASADYPQIRLFTVQKTTAQSPRQTPVATRWDICTPQTVRAAVGWNGFSAVGYFFGHELYNNLKVPIGLIHTSWGGTPAEAWVSGEALQTMPDYKAAVTQMQETQRANSRDAHAFVDKTAAWYSRNDPGTQSKWNSDTHEDADWKTIKLPGAWEQAGIGELAAFDGVVWFRTAFDLPAGAEGQTCKISLGTIDDRDTVWINGTQVGGMNDYAASRVYAIPAGVLKPGKNVVAVRVLDTGGEGGFTGQPGQMAVTSPSGLNLSLAGAWKYKIGTPLGSAQPLPLADSPNTPTMLYNGMIAPLLPYGIKGAIWYQGESNAGRAYQYRTLLPTLIEDWRARWHEGNFPFYIVQLANFQQTAAQPGDNDWAELREAQSLTSAHVPNAGLAVTIDIGDAGDIHPKNKQDVGKRLALAALAQTYGEKIEYSGPQYKAMKIEDDKVRLTFTHIGGGLTTHAAGPSDTPASLQGFAIAGEDHKFVWAEATFNGNAVLVSSPNVPHPVAVRYAWAVNPICNLYNKAGLPASPFRTDDWPGVTVKNK